MSPELAITVRAGGRATLRGGHDRQFLVGVVPMQFAAFGMGRVVTVRVAVLMAMRVAVLDIAVAMFVFVHVSMDLLVTLRSNGRKTLFHG